MSNNISTNNKNNFLNNYFAMNNNANNEKNISEESVFSGKTEGPSTSLEIVKFILSKNKKASSTNFDPVSFYSKIMAANTPRQTAKLCQQLATEIAKAKKNGCDDIIIMKMQRLLESAKGKKISLEKEEKIKKEKDAAELSGEYEKAREMKDRLEKNKNARMCTEVTEFHQIATEGGSVSFNTQI